jgi:7,8-dihydropterin-6-yl-methyl-4-(beta-D-ribofuranosyl)aminobenzene 5'-phosphate synthase
MSLAATKDVMITMVVDNYADLLLGSTPAVDRRGPEKEPLLAEHGLSIHIRLAAEGKDVLLDAGFTKVALPYNLSRLEIDPAVGDGVVISHGHRDHTAAPPDFLRIAGRRLPVVVHPDAFLERWFILSDGSKVGPWQVKQQRWREAGAEIVYVEESYELVPGCLATGPIPRRTDFEKGMARAYYRKDGELVQDPTYDDQAVVVNLQGKGLVVTAGCVHSGIVNTVLHARSVTGVIEVWAVIGGFHLSHATAEEIGRTIAELKAIGPSLVMPAQCTGFAATSWFAEEMPDQFVVGAVGTRLVS